MFENVIEKKFQKIQIHGVFEYKNWIQTFQWIFSEKIEVKVSKDAICGIVISESVFPMNEKREGIANKWITYTEPRNKQLQLIKRIRCSVFFLHLPIVSLLLLWHCYPVSSFAFFSVYNITVMNEWESVTYKDAIYVFFTFCCSSTTMPSTHFDYHARDHTLYHLQYFT